jgi:hypothetical protein
MLRTTTVTLALAASVLTAGCLRSETTHVLYISPDGAVTWMTTEADVHSDEKDPAARLAEEREYLSAVQAGMHPMAQGLAALTPAGPVRSHVVRAERPFTIATMARFEALDGALQRLLDENGVQAVVSARSDGDRAILHLAFDFAVEATLDSHAGALLGDVEHFSFVLTEGRFVETDGFDMSDDGRSARISTAWLARSEEAWKAKGTIDLSLTWRLD